MMDPEQEEGGGMPGMLPMPHKKILWIYWALHIAGIWMILAPSPSKSDFLSGLVPNIFGWRSPLPNWPTTLLMEWI
jgi:hypothetical protein